MRDAILECRADPTAMTPCADIMATASIGWVQVLTDPRTTLSQCLGVILAAEAGDAEGWTLLVHLAEELGFTDLAEKFNDALVQEEAHAAIVRTWLTSSVLGQSGAQPTRRAPTS